MRRAPPVAMALRSDAQNGDEACAIAGYGWRWRFLCGPRTGSTMSKGGLRVSFVHDTQAQEVDKLISALDQVI